MSTVSLPLALLTLTIAVAQAPPPPDLALDTCPAAAREDVAAAAKRAAANPHDAAAAGALGRVLQAWEQWEAAHQSYERARALAPDAFEWPYLDAVVLQRLARQEDAVAALRTVLDRKPGYLPARVRLAEALLEAGQADLALPLFSALLTEPAAEPAARMGLGRIAAMEGKHDAAVQNFARAIELFPELGAAHYGLARSYRAMGRAADAERELELHAKYGPRWPKIEDPVLAAVNSVRDDGRALLLRGVASVDAGDVPSAIAAHEAALARDPSLTQIHANLLSLYGRAGEWAKAGAQYKAALAAGIGTADVHYDYGVVQALQGRFEEAEEAYRRAIAVNPLHTNARINLGQILERRRDFAGAAAEYARAVESQPTFRLARFNLGRMLLVTAPPEAAIAEFEKLQQPRDAETPRYLFALSAAQVRAGRKEEGIRLAAEAKRMALEYGQSELAAAIDRDLARLK
jgi:tetratricopeptide (TPR) repeat protein